MRFTPINTMTYLLEWFLLLYNRIYLHWNVYVKITI